MTGRFITLEGPDGGGKSTQIMHLSGWLTAQGIPHITTREPGGSPYGAEIRHLLLEGAGDKWDGLSEALLLQTDRNEHLRQVIRPALAAGTWVISDRFADSTMVFQSIKGVPAEQLRTLIDLVVGTTWPDLTFILDVAPEEGMRRKTAQAKLDRFEALGTSFQAKVRAGYLEIAHQSPARCHLVDASRPEVEVTTSLTDEITKRFLS